jgi:transmembrane sensor
MDRETFLTLLTKKIAGELAEGEELQLFSAIETNEEYRQIHDGLMLHSSAVELTLNPEKRLATVWGNIERTAENNKRRPVFSVHYLRLIAASVLIIVFFYWMISKNSPDAGKEGVVTINTQYQRIDTVLTDGSRIVLSENSQLSFNKNFGSQTRSVTLNGDAFFDVAENINMPMLVQAGPVNIIVKGTAFYVNNDGGRNVEVKLLRGLVEVSNRRDSSDKVLLKPNQRLFISEIANHNLQYTIAGLSLLDTLKPVSNSDTLNFVDKTLDSLALLLEKRYHAKIEIKNETLKSKRFSGRFVTETLQEALEALRFTYPFSFKAVDKTIIIE